VKAFRTRLEQDDTQPNPLGFARTADFSEVFRRDIELWLNHPDRPWHQPDAAPLPSTPPRAAEPFVDAWLGLLAHECDRLPLEVLDPRQGLKQSTDPIRLHDVFVPLKATAPPRPWLESKDRDLLLARQAAEDSTNEPVPVLELLERERLAVLIGDPGSGKTALLNLLSWA